jgi:hypothetical protein
VSAESHASVPLPRSGDTVAVAPLDGPETPESYFAKGYHRQFLAKNVEGSVRYYCPDNGTGVACPVGLEVASAPSSAG